MLSRISLTPSSCRPGPVLRPGGAHLSALQALYIVRLRKHPGMCAGPPTPHQAAIPPNTGWLPPINRPDREGFVATIWKLWSHLGSNPDPPCREPCALVHVATRLLSKILDLLGQERKKTGRSKNMQKGPHFPPKLDAFHSLTKISA